MRSIGAKHTVLKTASTHIFTTHTRLWGRDLTSSSSQDRSAQQVIFVYKAHPAQLDTAFKGDTATSCEHAATEQTCTAPDQNIHARMEQATFDFMTTECEACAKCLSQCREQAQLLGNHTTKDKLDLNTLRAGGHRFCTVALSNCIVRVQGAPAKVPVH